MQQSNATATPFAYLLFWTRRDFPGAFCPSIHYTAKCWQDSGSMLAQRPRQWPSIVPHWADVSRWISDPGCWGNCLIFHSWMLYLFLLREVLNYRHIFPRRDRTKQKDETPHQSRERPSCPWMKGTILDLRPISDLESCILRVVSYIYFIALFSIRGLTCQIKAALLNWWYVTVCYCSMAYHNKILGAGDLVQWLKLPAWKVGYRRFDIVGSLRDREVACSASARISNAGGQCHLIHLTIRRRFSWPSLAYMYGAHKGTLSVVIFFISFVRNNITFVRNINNISFVRNIISFVRNIISFVRNNISFVRNDFVCTKYYFVCTK